MVFGIMEYIWEYFQYLLYTGKYIWDANANF